MRRTRSFEKGYRSCFGRAVGFFAVCAFRDFLPLLVVLSVSRDFDAAEREATEIDSLTLAPFLYRQMPCAPDYCCAYITDLAG